jgi:hypothetical protein
MSFISVSQVFDETRVFVVPTFQRPYAWGDEQWNDLLRDIQVASKKVAAYHYFGAIHTVLVEPADQLWGVYVDPDNLDTAALTASNFRATTKALNVHFVVDGQQRLITLYSLLERSQHDPARFAELPNGRRIPKVILSPAADHVHWRELLGLDSLTPPIQTRSQQRLRDLFGLLTQHAPAPGSSVHDFLVGPKSQLIRIDLPSGASLSPFLTLNDRGKELTRLEKVKGLAMEADETNNGGLARNLHTLFGCVYRSIDQLGSLLDEDGFVRQLGVALWEHEGESAHKLSLDALYATYRGSLALRERGDPVVLLSRTSRNQTG